MKHLGGWFLGLLLLTGGVASASSVPVMSDKAAAAAVIPQHSGYDTHPDNYFANHTTPTATQLAAFHATPLNFQGGPPASDFAAVDGAYIGTTDQIIQWAVAKWGFTPYLNYFRAEAMEESGDNQGGFGDLRYTTGECVGGAWNGWLAGFGGVGGCVTSYGIMQVKAASFNTMPYSRNSTAFNVDFRLAYFAACMKGDIAYLDGPAQTAGYPSYPSGGTYQQQVDGCMGDWFSGDWYSSGALSYIAAVKAQEAAASWQSGIFITAPVEGATIRGAAVPVTVWTDPNVCYTCLDFNGRDQGCDGGAKRWTLNSTAANNGLNGPATLHIRSYDCSDNPLDIGGIAVNVAN